jgi:hypothetical protein
VLSNASFAEVKQQSQSLSESGRVKSNTDILKRTKLRKDGWVLLKSKSKYRVQTSTTLAQT